VRIAVCAKARLNDFAIELLAVPVPLGSRYRGEPIYFSGVVVRRDSGFRVFNDLRGSSWAYNEPLSHSGFNVVRAYLAGFGHSQGFFREVVESGSHIASIEMILNGRVEASAIDTTVLDWVIDQRPEVGAKIVSLKHSVQARSLPGWRQHDCRRIYGPLYEEHFSACMKIARDAPF
jgi:phosphonate transport system substrate-binding protein